MVGKQAQGERVERLRRHMAALGIDEDDLEERFVRAQGPGGQKVNKTSSAVHLHHRPSGLRVKAQSERSQAENRLRARERLCERLEAARRAAREEARDAQERARRQRRRPSAGARRRNVADKRRRGARKQERGRPDPGGE
jgi:protein subunit release factor B